MKTEEEGMKERRDEREKEKVVSLLFFPTS
jgi:hypothetical protein